MIRLFSLFLCPAVMTAQPFGFGIKAGGRITGDLDSFWATSESKRYAVGPMVTARLPLGFRLEFDALYRRVGYRTAFAGLGGSSAERDRGNSWEFPLIVRRALWRGVNAGVGYAPRVINGSGHVAGVSVTSFTPLTMTYSEFNTPGWWDTTHGVVGAAGIERRAGPLRIAPEVRYVHWNMPAVNRYGSRGFSIVSTEDQVDVLVGITFP